jgi:hypothetical protein
MSLLPTVGHVDYITSAIKGINLKESIIGIESAMQRVVVELFLKIRFGRAELFFSLSMLFLFGLFARY